MSATLGRDLMAAGRDLTRRFGLRSPFAGQAVRERDLIVRDTLASGSTACNPKPITAADVEGLLDRLFSPY
jgi:alcohol dehydrogenase class IV